MFRSSYTTNTSPVQTSTCVAPVATFWQPTHQRWMLLIGSMAMLAIPLTLLAPAAHWANDPELFRLLKGMGVVKGLIALIAFSAVWWRLGRVVSKPMTVLFIGGVCAMALATGLIWELTMVLPASGLFHLATLTLLIAAWHDIEPRV